MKITAPPRSDQLNGDDFSGGRTATVTIAGIKEGSTELAPYDISLTEVRGRVWRPPLTVLRLLMAAWGDDSADWVGRKVTLYRDDSVRVGKEVMGGIRVSHASHLPTGNKPFTTKITSTRGRKSPVTVQPIPADAPTSTPAQTHTEPTAEQVAASCNLDELRGWWEQSGPERRTQIEARVAELSQPLPQTGADVDPSGVTA